MMDETYLKISRVSLEDVFVKLDYCALMVTLRAQEHRANIVIKHWLEQF